ncbi:MAG: 50S ribosomal protein L31 [Verrucomicrobiota bacterium]|nr:50S ribosomal protein L31 [Verrucomicrobiota bacterium]
MAKKVKQKKSEYFTDAIIACACGKKWQVESSVKEAKVGICSACHPFFTGQQKLLDTEGRVERFKRRWAKK